MVIFFACKNRFKITSPFTYLESDMDIKDGQTVKGTNFVNLRQAGDPVELGRAYSEQGVNMATDEFEVKYKDIAATNLTMNDIEKCQLSVDLATPTRLNLSAEVGPAPTRSAIIFGLNCSSR